MLPVLRKHLLASTFALPVPLLPLYLYNHWLERQYLVKRVNEYPGSSCYFLNGGYLLPEECDKCTSVHFLVERYHSGDKTWGLDCLCCRKLYVAEKGHWTGAHCQEILPEISVFRLLCNSDCYSQSMNNSGNVHKCQEPDGV